ncbi:isochorismatase family protein [Sodalis sp. RH15]|uniref:isochorismatase family protein n=1 Tax=Sodalis sp. RH15 TaxID=3394330 RepID=UPI0039B3BF10
MALTTLDPNTALILIDLQKGILSYPTVHPVADVLRHARELADAFRRHGLPVVLVNVDAGAPGRTEQSRNRSFSADWAELATELNAQPSDHRVTKRTWGAFSHTDLNGYLQQAGVTQVVIAGISTSAGVESTARHAHENGYNVTLAVDAMTDTNADVHINSISRIFPRLGETGASGEIISLLDGSRS